MSLSVIAKPLGRSVATIIGSPGSYSISPEDLEAINELVSAASLRSILWSSNGIITLKRNDVVILELFGSGEMRLSEIPHIFSEYSNLGIDIEFSGNGTLIMEFNKVFGVNLAFLYFLALSPYLQSFSEFSTEDDQTIEFPVILDYPIIN